MQRLVDRLEAVLFLLAAAGLLGSMAIAFVGVILRYGFNQSLEWMEEGARYLALFSALIAAGPVARHRGHIALDLLTTDLQGVRKELHRLAVSAITLAVATAVFLWGMRLVIQTYDLSLRTSSLQFPQWLPYSIVPLGMAVLVLFSIFDILAALQALRKGGLAAPFEEPTTATSEE